LRRRKTTLDQRATSRHDAAIDFPVRGHERAARFDLNARESDSAVVDISTPTREHRHRAPIAAAPTTVARLLSLLLPAALALYANFQGVQQILVPVQVEAMDPRGKIANLALLTMLCSITGVLGLTAGGAASDATRSRWGRRAPWLVCMAVASALLSMSLGLQSSLIGVAALYGGLWFTLNFFQGALLAVTPDRVPESRRSLASSIFGLAGPLGALIGVNLAAIAPAEWGYVSLAALLATATATFVIFAREDAWLAPAAGQAKDETNPPGRRLRMTLGLLESFSSRDFSLAYAFRVLMFIAQFSINNYLLYILQDHIGVQNAPARNAQIAAGVLNSLRTMATVFAIFIGLWLANRTERRKLFAQVYAVAMAAAMVVPVLSPTWSGMLIFASLGGIATGVYATVDLTLMSLVLPNKDSAGRDLALLVMAGAAAQFVAPLIGGVLIKFLGYDELFLVAAVITLVAGAVTFFIRGAR
jgi:MFS family permease